MPDYKGLTIRFDGDASNLISALQQIDNATERTTSMLSRINTALKLDPGNQKLYSMQTRELTNLIDSQQGRIGKLNTALGENRRGYIEASKKVKEYGSRLDTAKQRLHNLQQEYSGYYAWYKTHSGFTEDVFGFKAAEDEVAAAQEAYDQAVASQEGYRESIAHTKDEIELATSKLGGLKDAMYDAQIEEGFHASRLGQTSIALGQYADGLDLIGDKLLKIGGVLTVGGIAGMLSIGRSVLSETEEYGNAISKVGGYLEITGDELEHMSDLALQFGKDTRYSAVEAADAMSELAKGGMTQAQIEGGALDATLQLASAGNLSLAQAAETAVQAINVFGLDAADASQVADALAGAANRSTAEVNTLAESFRYVSGWAGLADYPIQDVTGALGLLADRGLQAEVAGTGLRNVLQRIGAPTDKAKKLLEKYGFEAYNAEGKMKPLVELVQELNDSFGELGDQERNEVLNTIFGARGLPAAVALMDAGTKELEDYIDATKRVGYAEQMAQAQMGEIGWALEYLRGEFETFQVNLGTAFTPIIKETAENLENLLAAFNNMSKAEQMDWAKGIVEVALVGPKLLAVGTAFKVFAGATRGLSTVTRFFGYLGSIKKKAGDAALTMSDFGRAIAKTSDGAVKASTATSLLTTGLALLAVSAAAFVAIKLWQDYQKSREEEEKYNRVIERSKTFMDDAAEAADGLSESFDEAGEASETARTGIGKAADAAKDSAKLVSDLTDSLNEFYDKVAERNTELDTTSSRLDEAYSIIEKYGGKEWITDEGTLAALAGALYTVNSELGTNYALHSDTGGVIYDENDAVVTLTDSVWKLIDAKKAEMKAEAYGELYKDAIKEQEKAKDARDAAYDSYLEAKKWKEENPYGSGITEGYYNDVIENYEKLDEEYRIATENVEQMGDAYDQFALEAQRAAEGTRNALAENIYTYDGLKEAVEEAGISVSDFTGLTEDEFAKMVKDAEGDVAKIIEALEEWNRKRIEDKYANVYVEDNLKEVEDHISEAKRKLRDLDGTSANIYIRAKQSTIPAYERAAGGIRTHAEGGIAAYANRYHAGGSIVNVPVTGYPLDLVGEAGAEAIVPLTNRRYSQPFVDLIANGVASRMSGGDTFTIQLAYDAGADANQMARDLMREVKRIQLTRR